MEDNPVTSTPLQTADPVQQLPAGLEPKKTSRSWVYILVGLLLLGLVITGLVFLFQSSPAAVGKIRDVFIIFLALEFLIIGIALVVLVIQVAMLINVLQNEIKPILETTNETVSTLKGTTTFISNNLTGPVIKMNEYLAGLRKLLELLFPPRR